MGAEHVEATASEHDAPVACPTGATAAGPAGVGGFGGFAARDPRAILALQRMAGNRAVRRALARTPTKATATAPKCSHVVVNLPGQMTFYGNRKALTAGVTFRQALAPGKYKISYDKGTDQFLIEPGPGEVFIDVAFSTVGTQSEIDREVALFKAYLASMTTPVDLTVEGSGGSSGGGNGAGGADGTAEPDAKAGKGEGQKGGEGSGDLPPPSTTPDGGPPAIEITDPKQIDELKKRGLIPADKADSIKAKLGTDEPLTFDEAIALLDAMNAVIAPPKGDAKTEGRTSWLEWAKFVQANKDKISGTAQSAQPGKEGLKPEDVKAIIAKEKEFVGIKDPPMTTLKDKLGEATHDPEMRKSWNELEKWERDLWAEYQRKHGGSVQSDRKDLHITAEDKFWMALRMSPDYMEEGSRDAARAMFDDPVFIGGLVVGIGAYLALWAVPEPLFSKATAVMTTIALASLITFSASELINLAKAWMDLSAETKDAKSVAELEKAAERFGKRIGAAGLRILLALAMVLLGKALPAPKAAPPMGPGGPTPLPAGPGFGGAAAVETAASTVKVVNGVIVVTGPAGALAMSASQSGGGGGSGDKDSGKGKAPDEAPKSAEAQKPVETPTELRARLRDLPEDQLNRLLARIVRGDAKGRKFGTPRNDRMPTVEEFNPRIQEVRAGAVEKLVTDTRHGLNPEQAKSVSGLTNEELVRLRLDDPISGTVGKDGGLSLTGGHHRVGEIVRRVASGQMSADEVVRWLIHD